MSVRILASLLLTIPAAAFAQGNAPRPPAMQMQNVPQVPLGLASATKPYLEYRTAEFEGWNAADRSMLVRTRFGNTAQLHSIKSAGAARTQISFEDEPVSGSWSPSGDVLLVSRDTGGSEFYQLYTLANGKLTLLTDGKSRNEFGSWNKDGSLVGYSSTRRNGSDGDLYVIDPRNPASNRMVAQVEGNGWNIEAFTADQARAVVTRYRSVSKTELWLLDLADGKLTPIGNHGSEVSYNGL
jgi:Tol biopolymer transport system component